MDELFAQTFVGPGSGRKPVTLVVGFLFQIVGVGIMVLIPMLFLDVLPSAAMKHVLIAPSAPSAPPPPSGNQPRVQKVTPRQFDPGKLQAPGKIPAKVTLIIEEAPLNIAGNNQPGVPGGIPCGRPGLPPCGTTPGGLPWGIPAVPAEVPPPPQRRAAAPPPAPIAPAVPPRVAVGGRVQAAKLIAQVAPVYPEMARRIRLEGVVNLNAVIGADGRILNLTAVSGHPWLVKAALDAVQHWRYQPTTLNEQPTEVVTTIEVRFTLNR